MQLTKRAQKLQKQRENGEELTSDTEELASCMGSEDFCYALYEGGYLKPEDWVDGEDLVKLQEAVKVVGEFKRLVESLHEEF